MPQFHLKVVVSILNRNLSRLTPQISCLFVVAHSLVLRKIVQQRQEKGGIGFTADVKNKDDSKKSELFRQVEATDLVKFGLIPEFIGRLPVIATLEELMKKH